ncbi:hypothetical protein Q1695_016324 [Nippostrongylus brasiliensis]|nr:hypothetical protein Q1695_016324 [Nippostrongylus brasiliensis]
MIDRKQQDFRICMLYEFRLGHSAKGAFMRLSRVYGEKLSYRTICGYFNRFRQGDYSLKHQGCHGPRRIDDNLLAAFLKQNPTVKCDELAGIFDVKLSTLYSHLRNLRQGSRSNFITWKHEMARKSKMEMERKRVSRNIQFNSMSFFRICLITLSNKWFVISLFSPEPT